MAHAVQLSPRVRRAVLHHHQARALQWRRQRSPCLYRRILCASEVLFPARAGCVFQRRRLENPQVPFPAREDLVARHQNRRCCRPLRRWPKRYRRRRGLQRPRRWLRRQQGSPCRGCRGSQPADLRVRREGADRGHKGCVGPAIPTDPAAPNVESCDGAEFGCCIAVPRQEGGCMVQRN